MRHRHLISIVMAAAVAGVVYWYTSAPQTGNRVQLPVATPVSIDISVWGRQLTTVTNAEGLAALMIVLRTGRSVELHECKDRGTMVLRFSDSPTLGIGFLPGHHRFRYEFAAQGGLFAVSRSQFLGALKTAGVDVQQIPTR